MQNIRFVFGLLVLVSFFGLPPGVARSDGEVTVEKRMEEPISPAAASFQNFCGEWMKKLSEREVRNHSLASAVAKDEKLVMHYTGYGKAPRSCEVRETGVPGQPFVGRLVYDEIEYRKVGLTALELASQEPLAYMRIEVMEIFRYDGKKWVY